MRRTATLLDQYIDRGSYGRNLSRGLEERQDHILQVAAKLRLEILEQAL